MEYSKELRDALAVTKSATVYKNQLRLAGIQFDTNRQVEHQGGRFSITPDMLGYLHHCKEIELDRTVLLDEKNLPVVLEGIDDFLNIASGVYHSALNAYCDAVAQITNTRDPAKMLGMVDD